MGVAIPVGGNFYTLESKPVSAQECINLYARIPEAPTITEKYLVTTPGIELATTAGLVNPNRGGHVFLNKPYFVQGDELYRIDQTFDANNDPVYTAVLVSGAVSIPGDARVVLADNGTEGGQMCLVCPDVNTQFNAYIYTTGAGLVQISDADFDGPVNSVVFVDGYFLFTKTDGQIFFISALRNGTSYNALDIGSAEADPDSVVAPVILRNSPYIFGKNTVEPFQNVGGADFPFVRIPGGVQNKGLKSIWGACQINDLIVFLGGAVNETPKVWITDGGSIQPLSTTAIDRLIATYTPETIENSFTWNYSQDGCQFVAFVFPGERCFVYDFTSKLWHTRVSIDDNDDVPCRVSVVLDVYGILMVADLYTNQIGILSRSEYEEYGEQVQRTFVTPQLDNQGMPFFIDAIELVADSGEGLTTGQGSDPMISLSYSRDGGRTFSNQLARSAGSIGEYQERIIWNCLGRFAREVCFKFQTTDPIKWVFLKVEASFE